MLNDLFVLFPDLPWPRHSWRSLAEQIRDRRRRLEEVRREAQRSIEHRRGVVAQKAAGARARVSANRERAGTSRPPNR